MNLCNMMMVVFEILKRLYTTMSWSFTTLTVQPSKLFKCALKLKPNDQIVSYEMLVFMELSKPSFSGFSCFSLARRKSSLTCLSRSGQHTTSTAVIANALAVLRVNNWAFSAPGTEKKKKRVGGQNISRNLNRQPEWPRTKRSEIAWLQYNPIPSQVTPRVQSDPCWRTRCFGVFLGVVKRFRADVEERVETGDDERHVSKVCRTCQIITKEWRVFVD